MQRKSIDWFLYGWNMEKMYLEIFFAYRDLIRLSSVMLPLLAITWVFGVFRMVNNDKFSKYMFHVFNIVQVSIHLHFNLLFLRYMDQKITVSAKSFWHRWFHLIYFPQENPETYLETSRTSTMELFCKIFY